MRLPSRLIVTIAAGALAVAGGSTLADAHDGGGHGNGGDHHGKRHGRDDRGKHNGNAVLRSALFGSKTTAHGGPTLFGVAPGGIDWVINGKSKAKVSRDGRVRVRIDGPRLRRGSQRRQEHGPAARGHRLLRRHRRRHDQGRPLLARGRRGHRRQAGHRTPQPVPRARRADQPGPGRHARHGHRTSRRAVPSSQTGRSAQAAGSPREGSARPPALSAAASPRARCRDGCRTRRPPRRGRRRAGAWRSAARAPRERRRER